MKLKWNVTKKRKANQEQPEKSDKRRKKFNQENAIDLDQLNALSWKKSTTFTGDEFAPEIEELDGFDVIYANNPSSGTKPMFIKSYSNTSEKNKPVKGSKMIEKDFDEILKNDMKEWDSFNLDKRLLKSLDDQNFTMPTEIQRKVYPIAVKNGKDVAGISETGSGKSLAFCLPIVSELLKNSSTEYLPVLILIPTRELAVQLRNHVDMLTKYTKITSAVVFGGMSIEKQERVLKSKPQILIATPGRLSQLLSEANHPYLADLKALRFLVIDEADRMVEKGHFKDLESIFSKLRQKKLLSEWNFDKSDSTGPEINLKRQTFVFSATLFSSDENLKKIFRSIPLSKRGLEIVDATTKKILAQKLDEKRIDCLVPEKDAYLLYFINNVKGKILVFANSIDSVKKLTDTMKILKVPVLSLHSQMQQKGRLESIEKFSAKQDVVLISSDVAARGLDIPFVDFVIHYHVPKTKELYVHRSGRTARANRSGKSVIFCAPEERKSYHQLLKSLNRDEILPFEKIPLSEVSLLSKVTHCASKIGQAEYRNRRENKDRSWMKKTAEEMDLIYSEPEDDMSEEEKSAKSERSKFHLENLKRELSSLLESMKNRRIKG